LDLRAQCLAGRATRLRRDGDQRRQTRDLVHLARNRDAFLDVLELDGARVLADDGTGERIPGGDLAAGLDLRSVDCEQRGAVRYLVAFTLASVLVDDDDFPGARD